MPPSGAADSLRALTALASGTKDLDVLLLFGSRARRDAASESDWDFGYLGGPRLDAASLMSGLVETLGTDRVDLVDLARAGGLLRYQAARDGRVIYEARPRLAEQFRLDASAFWCDAAPLMERGYDDVLADLTR